MLKLHKVLLSSVLSGIFISIGGVVFISCASTGYKIIGSVFFCVALLSICMLELYLFTGKVGFIIDNHSFKNIIALFIGLLGNFIGATICGCIIGHFNSSFRDFAADMCSAKSNTDLFAVLFYGFMCGILMYTAVYTYKSSKTITGIIFCVPVFILSGFEHSIADMFYFAAADFFTLDYFIFIILVIVGNALGGMFVPFVRKLVKE